MTVSLILSLPRRRAMVPFRVNPVSVFPLNIELRTLVSVFAPFTIINCLIIVSTLVIPAERLCRNAGNHHQSSHTGAGRYPELTDNTGFRVALRLPGMTKK